MAVPIRAPLADVWAVVTDIEHAAATLSAVEQVEVLDRPGPGLLGLRWRETRTVFGRAATETMWVTEVDAGRSYATEARSHGSVYRSGVSLEEAPTGTLLRMTFAGEATTLAARILSGALGFLVRRSVRNALLRDAEDVKAAVEARSSGATSEHPGGHGNLLDDLGPERL